MVLHGLDLAFERLAAPLPIWRARVAHDDWLRAAQAVAAAGGRLVALWGSDRRANARAGGERHAGDAGGFAICAAYATRDGLAWLDLTLEGEAPDFPDLVPVYPAAGRMQRAVADTLGIAARHARDSRPWLDHGTWPAGFRPIRHDAPVPARPANERDAALPADYPFVRVEGDGVHEIAVGPVHAGIIEPGHFRFSVVGEKVLRLEERLGYVHKGIERRFTELAPLDGHRLAGRVSGDSTVAFAWAWCMALESAAACVVPERAQWLRALMLERERIANHLGDLGALGNDAGFGVGLAQFMRLKEDLLRVNVRVFGARYPMDAVVAGGVARDIDAAGCELLLAHGDALARELAALRAIYDEHAGMQDRFIGCGRVSAELARELGLCGLAARASGLPHDLRCDLPAAPWDAVPVTRAADTDGDVAARVAVRFDECVESLRLCRELLCALPAGPVRAPLADAPPRGFGIGLVEGWRGPVFFALETAADGTIRRCHPHDPSWHNWPALEHAVIGNIVPDFPLINKSFNLSYSGVDL